MCGIQATGSAHSKRDRWKGKAVSLHNGSRPSALQAPRMYGGVAYPGPRAAVFVSDWWELRFTDPLHLRGYVAQGLDVIGSRSLSIFGTLLPEGWRHVRLRLRCSTSANKTSGRLEVKCLWTIYCYSFRITQKSVSNLFPITSVTTPTISGLEYYTYYFVLCIYVYFTDDVVNVVCPLWFWSTLF